MLANDFQDILLNEKRYKSIYTVCRIFNEKGNQNIKLYTHILNICVHMYFSQYKSTRHRPDTNEYVTYTEQMGIRWKEQG